MKNQEHQAQMYACLWMLISEQDESKFLHNQDTFMSYWQEKEPEFVAYYRQEYHDRTGLKTPLHILAALVIQYVLLFCREMGTVSSQI